MVNGVIAPRIPNLGTRWW